MKKGHDYSTILIWSAALVTVVRYAAAFIASDSVSIESAISQVITYAMGFSGLGMGVLDVIGGAYLFDGWRRTMPRNGQAWPFRFKILTFFALGLVVNGILILIPFTMSRVSGTSMHVILGNGFWLFGWSMVVNVAPYLLIGGVTTGNQLLTNPANEQANGDANRSANHSPVRTEQRSSSRTYGRLSDSEKYFILNAKSSDAAKEFSVTSRAIQKWRKMVQDEISQGKL